MALILLVAEVEGGVLTDIGAQLALAAKNVAGAGDEIAVAVMSDDPAAAAESAAGLDVSTVFSIAHPALADGGTGGFDAPVSALAALCAEKQPSVVLLGKTDFGANVGPRVAFRLGSGFAQDCIDLKAESAADRIAVTRPVFGGNAMAVYRFRDRDTQVATIRPNVFEPDETGAISGTGGAEIVQFDAAAAIGEPRSRLIEVVAEESKGVRLEDADVVISGGRGLGGPAPFERLQELSDLLGGALGASRAACDAGWIDHGHQIGLTGKSISPRVYITFGISGASQHMAGCSGAKAIVAINKDPDANIFKEARFGVVGDWEKVLNGFMATVQELTGN